MVFKNGGPVFVKKIGILTFHYVLNYGAVLQTWALSSSIQALGHQAEVIDYRPPEAHTMQSRKGWRALVPSWGKLRMDRFVRTHIPLSPKTMTTRAALEAYTRSTSYDALVCGSDQVWFTPGTQPFEPAYFLDVPTAGDLRRFSYAPSAGPLRDFGEHTAQIAPALARFNAISVRDSNTMAAVSKLETVPVIRVVDPTMIADFSPLLRGTPQKDYIAVVGKMDAAAERYIRFAAKTLNLPVVTFGTRSAVADKARSFANPVEWLNGIAGARLVITSLFHGAAVSLALRTPFVALDCGGRAFKLEDLCAHCGIPERLLLRGTVEDYVQDSALLEMDYTALTPRLDALATASRDYLSEAIHG